MATQETGTVAVLAEKPSVARDIARVLRASSTKPKILACARYANRAGCRPIISLQNASRSPVGKPCAPAPPRRSASFCEEAEVDTPRPAPLGLAVQSVARLAVRALSALRFVLR